MCRAAQTYSVSGDGLMLYEELWVRVFVFPDADDDASEGMCVLSERAAAAMQRVEHLAKPPSSLRQHMKLEANGSSLGCGCDSDVITCLLSFVVAAAT